MTAVTNFLIEANNVVYCLLSIQPDLDQGTLYNAIIEDDIS